MTTITATPQLEAGGIQLSIASLETIDRITRSDANGVADVRTLPGLLPWRAQRVEDLRQLVKVPTTTTGFTAARCTLATSDLSYCRATADGTGLTYLYYGQFTGAGGMVPVVPGDQLATNVQLRNPNAVAIQVRLSWFFYDAGGANLPGTVQGDMTTLSPGAQPRIWLTTTAPAGAVTARPILYFYTATGSNPGAGLLCDWKYFGAYKGPKAWENASIYFHGSYGASDVYEYTWAGTGYASESIRWVAAGDLIVTDYEAASGQVNYTAGASAQASLTWALDSPRLVVPVMPNYSVQLRAILDYSASGQSLGSVQELLGREDPVAILRGMGTRRGTLRLYCGTFAEALEVVQATRRGEVLMLRQPEHEGMDMYFACVSYGIPTLDAQGGESVFGVDLGYVQVAIPQGPLTGALGWTFAALAARGGTFATLPRTYTTFQDLLLDRAK